MLAGIATGLQVVIQRQRRSLRLALPAILFVLVPYLAISGNVYAQEDGLQRNVGSFKSTAYNTCVRSSDQTLHVPIFPGGKWAAIADRDQLCPDALAAQDVYLIEEYGLTSARTINMQSQPVFQPIRIKHQNAQYIDVFLANYSNITPSTYEFVLLQADCKNPIMTQRFNTSELLDNSYAYFDIGRLQLASNTELCFSFNPASPIVGPLAVSVSDADYETLRYRLRYRP